HPKYERWLEKDENRGRKDEPHWHIDSENVPYYHMGKAWGRADGGRWTWMLKKGSRWWTVADGAQRMVRYRERWWWRTHDCCWGGRRAPTGTTRRGSAWV
ncbi:hypothetical protein ACFL2T_07220, partial [Elusimicrobiota bacterium]